MHVHRFPADIYASLLSRKVFDYHPMSRVPGPGCEGDTVLGGRQSIVRWSQTQTVNAPPEHLQTTCRLSW